MRSRNTGQRWRKTGRMARRILDWQIFWLARDRSGKRDNTMKRLQGASIRKYVRRHFAPFRDEMKEDVKLMRATT
jgi:hypothetical protein